ncbi:MAG TPA: hypothetical protein VEC11_11315 [Allosphingosinicella sp.]|nr:hypothetical protein [Allosphingosinicella sp.]
MAAPDFARELIRPVSLKPAEGAVRDAGRLIAMVHELHKAGYQRIRILPNMAPNGVHWRCRISDADNFTPDGLELRGAGPGRVAMYSSGDGSRYFGWEDGGTLTARLLARRFLEVFPAIAAHGAGRDWAYAGWLTDVLGRAEHGSFVRFYADYPLAEDELALWRPPPVPAGA